MVRSMVVSLVAFMAALSTQGANAEIQLVASGGSGGTTPLLSIVSYFNTDDGVLYNADFTAIAPIDITFQVGAGPSATYYLGLPGGDTVTNDTDSPFLGFDVKVETIISGTAITLAGRDPTLFPNVIISDATEAKFSGPPGLQPGGTMSFGVTFTVPAFGGDFEYVELVLTPSVPEASTWAMMLAGFVGLGFAGYRASRRAALAA
jgi:hypothetical protein